MKRAQGALEFLTTYGWAFIVVLVMIGALTHFGVLNPASLAPERCVSPAGFECKDSQVLTEGQSIKFSNKLGYSIQISNASVETNSGNASCTSSPGLVGPDQEFTLICDKTGLVDGEKTKLDVSFSYYKPESGVGFAKSVESQLVSLVSQGSVSGSSGSGNGAGNEGSSNGGGSTPINTSVNSCRFLSDANTVYTLTADVLATSTTSGYSCFHISASNVTLDCAGHTITGPSIGTDSGDLHEGNVGSNGLKVGYQNSITIKNCVFKNFTRDVVLIQVKDSYVYDNTFLDAYNGLVSGGDERLTVRDNHFYNISKYSIAIGNSYGGTKIFSNTFDAPVMTTLSRGIMVWANSPRNSAIINTEFYNNDLNNMGYGYSTCCGYADYNKIYSNTIANSYWGIIIADGKSNIIESNNILSATYGLYVWKTFNTNFSSNNVNVKSGTTYGIYFRKETDQNNNRFVNNVITGSPYYGVYINHDPNTGVFSKNNTFIGTSITGFTIKEYIKQYDPAQSAWYTISSNEFVNDQIHNNTFQ